MQVKWYDINRLLSFNRILNFCIGARGIGKTYGAKKYVVNRFIKHGKQFIYLRRYKTELRKVKNFFNDIRQEFPDHEFKVKGWELYIDGKLAGYAMPLSAWQSEKSNAYPDVETILFDEFIREKDNSGYLPNEVSSLLNLMDTVFRNRSDVRTICLSNAVSVVNPYFLYFKLTPDIERRFNANDSIVIEIPDSSDFAEQRRETRFGKLITGTDYADMSLDNKFTQDSNVFIERRSKESSFVFAMIYQGLTLGVWVDEKRHLLYVSQEFDPSSKHIYALTEEDMDESRFLFNSYKDNYHLHKLGRAFKSGLVRFDNQVMRNIGYEVFKKLRLY